MHEHLMLYSCADADDTWLHLKHEAFVRENKWFLKTLGNDMFFRAFAALPPQPPELRTAVCNFGNYRVQVYRQCNGALVRIIGSQGSGNEKISHPAGVAFDSEGNLVVADCGCKAEGLQFQGRSR